MLSLTTVPTFFLGALLLIQTFTTSAFAAEVPSEKSPRERCIDYLKTRNADELNNIKALLDAKDSDALVAVSDNFTEGEMTGKVRGFDMKDRSLILRLDDAEIPMDAITHVRRVDVRTTFDEMSRHFTDAGFLKPMFEAQEKGKIVEVIEPDVDGVNQGRLTNLHTEDGQLVFSVDGNEHRPLRTFDFRIVD